MNCYKTAKSPFYMIEEFQRHVEKYCAGTLEIEREFDLVDTRALSTLLLDPSRSLYIVGDFTLEFKNAHFRMRDLTLGLALNRRVKPTSYLLGTTFNGGSFDLDLPRQVPKAVTMNDNVLSATYLPSRIDMNIKGNMNVLRIYRLRR
jgi:hypothetical protein